MGYEKVLNTWDQERRVKFSSSKPSFIKCKDTLCCIAYIWPFSGFRTVVPGILALSNFLYNANVVTDTNETMLFLDKADIVYIGRRGNFLVHFLNEVNEDEGNFLHLWLSPRSY